MILRTLWKVCEHIEALYDWERLMMQSGVTLNFVKRLGVYLLYIGCDPMTCHGSIIAPWTYPLSSARGSQARLRQTSTLVGDDSGSLGVELFCSFFSYCYWKATCQWMLAFSFHTACFMFYLIVFIFCLSLKRTLLHWMATEWPLFINVHWISTQCSSGANRQTRVEWALNVNWMWTECSLNLHWMCTWMCIECALNVNWN